MQPSTWIIRSCGASARRVKAKTSFSPQDCRRRTKPSGNGSSRIAEFGSPEAYKNIAGRVVAAASEEGLSYRPELVKRQPNTTDCHRLIHWADAIGKSAEMKQRLMELYFRDGGDLTDIDVLVKAAADCGLDADDVRRRLATDEDVALISAQAKDASDKGISGVPTFVFAQKYAVSGAQPAEQLARAIRQVSAEVNAQAAE